jgi:hypothetical protein
MPTFIELQQQVTLAKNKKVVLQQLIDYLDENFRSVADQPPKLTLLNDDKLPVPQDVFEAVIDDVLLDEAGKLDEEIRNVYGVVVNVPDPLLQEQPAPAPVPAPTAPAAEGAPLPAPVPVAQPKSKKGK